MKKKEANAYLAEEKLSFVEVFYEAKQESTLYYPSIGLLEYQKRQSTTAAENVFKSALITALDQTNFRGEISHQETLVIPMRKAKRQPAIKNALLNLPAQFQDAKFVLRRPDFLCCKYGFVIEVDGSAHWQISNRIDRDQTRHAEYKALGLDTFVIEHDWIFDPSRLNMFIDSIVRHIANQESDPSFKQEYQTRRTTVSRARSAFITSCGSSAKIGRFTRKNPKRLRYPNLKPATFQYDGYRYPFGKAKA